MKYIFFDTETNGLAPYGVNPENFEKFPRISQFSWQIYNEKQELVKEVNKLIYPDGWVFPDEEFFKLHANIENNKQFGEQIVDVLNEFIHDRKSCEYAIAHNMKFDSQIIRAEMFRANFKTEFENTKICTMSNPHVVAFCGLMTKNGRGGKVPKLEELHKKLFGIGFEGAHDGLKDVSATAKCFFELIRLNIIDLETEKNKQIEERKKYAEKQENSAIDMSGM